MMDGIGIGAETLAEPDAHVEITGVRVLLRGKIV